MANVKKNLLLFTFSLVLLSCNHPLILPNHFYSTSESDEKLKFLEQPLEKEDELSCQEKEMNPDLACWTAPYCRNFCEVLFINKKDEQTCQNWSLELVNRFSDLHRIMTKDVFQDISPETFKCFLKLTDNNPILLKNLTEDESKEFLLEIAFNYNLAYNLSAADNGDFSVLTALFRKISGRLMSAVKEPLGYNKESLLIEVYREDNQQAWNWLNDYLVYLCRKDSTCKEPLDYYCEILDDVSTKILTDFFENNSYFEKEYGKTIQSKSCGQKTCEYGNIQNFQQMCDGI